MKREMNRRAFLVAMLPSAVSFKQVGQVLGWAFSLFGCALAVDLLAGVHVENWAALARFALRWAMPALLGAWLLSRAFQISQEHRSARVRWMGRGAIWLLVALSVLAAAGFFYDFWQRKPAEAMVGAIVFLAMALLNGSSGARARPDADR